MPRFDIGIDLGTQNLLLSTPAGICVNEPTLLAAKGDRFTRRRILKVGSEAAHMLGRAPAGVDVVRPLSQGVISEFELTVSLLKVMLRRAWGHPVWFNKPRLLISLPSDVTPVEERAFREAALQAGAREVTLIPEPIAAALGAQIDIFRPEGRMLIDVGAGITEVALFSLGGVVFNHALRLGGNDMDEAVIHYVRAQYNFDIGPASAEALRQAASAPAAPESLELKGINLITRLPGTIRIRSAEITEAVAPLVAQIVQAVLIALERAPEELSADLIEAGVWLTGGASLTSHLAERIEEVCGLRVHVDEAPLLGVAQGELRLLREPELAAQVRLA